LQNRVGEGGEGARPVRQAAFLVRVHLAKGAVAPTIRSRSSMVCMAWAKSLSGPAQRAE